MPEELPYAHLVIRVDAFPRVVSGVQHRIDASVAHRNADLIDLTCRGSTPRCAQELCDGISRRYMRLRIDLQRASATATPSPGTRRH